jgi:hypothetical protein
MDGIGKRPFLLDRRYQAKDAPDKIESTYQQTDPAAH